METRTKERSRTKTIINLNENYTRWTQQQEDRRFSELEYTSVVNISPARAEIKLSVYMLEIPLV
jgi:hypothetical protein